jgi:hypothetical protein
MRCARKTLLAAILVHGNFPPQDRKITIESVRHPPLRGVGP